MAQKRKQSGKKKPAGKKTKQTNKKEKIQAANRKMIAFFVGLVLIFFSLSRLGPFGVLLYNLTRLLVGSTAILALILVLIWMFVVIFKKQFLRENKRVVPAFLLSYLGILLIFQLQFDKQYSHIFKAMFNEIKDFTVSQYLGGGSLGAAIGSPARTLFSETGVYVVVVILFIISAWLLVPSLPQLTRAWLLEKISKFKAKANERKEEKRLKKEKEEKEERLAQLTDNSENMLPNFENNFEREDETSPVEIQIPSYQSELGNEVDKADKEDEVINFQAPRATGNYFLPTVDLLAEVPIKDQSGERERVRINSQVLEETFNSFNISANVVSAVVGPSVTKYEIKLATGVKVSRVVNLADDLALALAAKDVRIEAPIPGKSLVGIEIPNGEVATVGFREMWENGRTNPQKLLEIPLGKALDGTIKTFDLSKMPHLLVAGSTGSGKSVAVNGIIASILMKALPSQVKFLMVDPKMVELSVYNDIPHLLIPVVTNPRKASRALQKVVDEMENRYELFSKFGVRNIQGYNDKIEKNNAENEYKLVPLPLIVVIVDELADLMMVASKEVEDAIIRLGQKARAAGIHMILATQRPSVDVISGLIKANVPSRVAFAVSSGTDSRTIIDANGAEKLLGRGDMLFKPIDENHSLRLQGAFLSDDDVEAVVSFIKNQADAEYDESFDPGEVETDDSRGSISSANSDSSDPLFEEARNLVVMAQKASTSQLQRALKVGFNRATDLMNELETKGIVGPAKGTTPRKVLVSPDGEFLMDDDE